MAYVLVGVYRGVQFPLLYTGSREWCESMKQQYKTDARSVVKKSRKKKGSIAGFRRCAAVMMDDLHDRLLTYAEFCNMTSSRALVQGVCHESGFTKECFQDKWYHGISLLAILHALPEATTGYRGSGVHVLPAKEMNLLPTR